MSSNAAIRMKKLKDERRETGVCTRCGRERDTQLLMCTPCRDKKKKCCEKYKKEYAVKNRKYRKQNWAKKKVWGCSQQDRKYGLITDIPPNYIDEEFLINIRETQRWRCHYCSSLMQMENMKDRDGLTVERISNDLPHIKSNCVLACHACNVNTVGTKPGKAEWLRERQAEVEVRCRESIRRVIDDIIRQIC